MLWGIWNFHGPTEIPFKGNMICLQFGDYFETRDSDLIEALRCFPRMDIHVLENDEVSSNRKRRRIGNNNQIGGERNVTWKQTESQY